MCRSKGNRIPRILKLKCLTSYSILGEPTLKRSECDKRKEGARHLSLGVPQSSGKEQTQ